MSRPASSERRGLLLFAIYAVASLIPVSIVGLVLIHGYQQQALNRGRDQGGAQAAVIEEMAIAPALASSDRLGDRLSRDQRSRLQSTTDLAIFDGSVVRLRLRSFSGAVSFSDDGTVLGAVSSSDPAFRRASGGEQVVTLVNGGQFAGAPAIRVLQPVIASSTGQAIGVLEVYLPYRSIQQKVAAETRWAVRRLGLGLAGLYAVLALISWWTTSGLRRHAAQQEHDALHDPLTGLPNREWFRRTVLEALDRGRHGEMGALVLVDLDHFKSVNDTLGHAAGDELLCVMGRRLVQALRTDDTVARLGGDEFGLVLPRVSDRDSTVALLHEVRERLAKEILLGSVTVSVKASFGVSFYPDDADDVEGLLQRADSAMYQGKHGSAGVVVHDPATTREASHPWMLEQDLQLALERDELRMYYQPVVTLASGRVDRVQACTYWQHPRRGLLTPADFMAVAWGSDMNEAFTAWTLARVLNDVALWRRQACGWNVGVPLPARALGSAGFVTSVTDRLTAAGLSTGDLHLDVVWTDLTAEAQADALTAGRALSQLGVRTSIDDYGAGETNWSQLRTAPVAEIRIAETFTGGIDTSLRDQAIVESLIHVAHAFGCVVSAKGVASQVTADWLTAAGCDYAQGVLWAAPSTWTDIASSFATATIP